MEGALGDQFLDPVEEDRGATPIPMEDVDMDGGGQNYEEEGDYDDDDEDDNGVTVVLNVDSNQQPDDSTPMKIRTQLSNKYVRPGASTAPTQKFTGPGGSMFGINTGVVPGQPLIYDLDPDTVEDKPWRKPGADVTDYFNYGFNEQTWKLYCNKQSQVRSEQALKGKIKVFEGDKSASNPPAVGGTAPVPLNIAPGIPQARPDIGQPPALPFPPPDAKLAPGMPPIPGMPPYMMPPYMMPPMGRGGPPAMPPFMPPQAGQFPPPFMMRPQEAEWRQPEREDKPVDDRERRDEKRSESDDRRKDDGRSRDDRRSSASSSKDRDRRDRDRDERDRDRRRREDDDDRRRR